MHCSRDSADPAARASCSRPTRTRRARRRQPSRPFHSRDMTASASPAVSRRPIALVLVTSLVLSLAIALWFPLVDPDEGRNAEVAVEMATDGDWIVPHLAGVPYLDKPPALFAAGAVAIRMLGRAPWVPRLPAIAAML